MKVLWITTSDTFYNQGATKVNTYNGVGWVASQQLEIMKIPDIELGIMFLTAQQNATKKIIEKVTYYPIIFRPNPLRKLYRYYFDDKGEFSASIKYQIREYINEFKPDILHLFGIECPLSDVIEWFDIPCVVHLQGLLTSIKNSFFPAGISKLSVSKFGNILREKIFRNGFNHGYRFMINGAEREKKLWKGISHVMGRTKWDNAIQKLYAPSCMYHHVDEILRPEFYSAEPVVLRKKIDTVEITSTISNTLYKGLDLILKTAVILDELGIKYRWKIIGIDADSSYERIINKALKIKTSPSIHFLGIKKADEIVSELQNSDLYIHPSYIDNSPNSICEAQLLGLPVIATNVGGVSSLIPDEESGVLVPANEPHMLAYKIIQLAKDYDNRKYFAENSRRIASARHDKNKIINDIISIYHTIINEKKPK